MKNVAQGDQPFANVEQKYNDCSGVKVYEKKKRKPLSITLNQT
jgi:hypothetical protein